MRGEKTAGKGREKAEDITKRIALICACSFLTYWLGSIAVCEYYTYRYRETFENIEVHDIDGIHDLKEEWLKDIKVLEYTDVR